MRGFVELSEYVRVCDERDRLADEVAYLRAEAGLAEAEATEGALRAAFGLTPSQAELLAILYRTRRRLVSRRLLNEMVSEAPGGARDERIIDVWTCKLRRKLGEGAIATLWGHGYRLTEAGIVQVEAALRAPAAGEGRPRSGGGGAR
ncbi:MAG: helix-turn-helix domain-containing protein [Caulobacteraceae bacterium]|nr:helix-turn-helix domain-containing protein [Caulobacteraceae bacterium]